MKRCFLLVLVTCFVAGMFQLALAQSSGSSTTSQTVKDRGSAASDDSTRSLGDPAEDKSTPRGTDTGGGSGFPSGFAIILTLVISAIALAFTIAIGLITYLAQRDRDRAREDLKKLERKSELIDQRQKDVVEQMDRYLDSALITFNNLLPEDKRLAIGLLKHVLHLRQYEDIRRFEAIKALGELGDETVIPYLEWAAETDKIWAADAKIAIDDIKKRVAQKPGKDTST